MIRFLLSAAIYLVANAIGLLVAAWALSGFTIDAMAFVVAVLLFSVIQTVLGPLVTKLSMRSFPQMMGGIALVTIFLGLFLTDILMPGMAIGGLTNWLVATLLVWIGSLVASILLPLFVFKEAAGKKRDAANR
ncbi:phage holin family protein [Cognatishimia sp. F0-27]|uniref:phage holin family protein n=1 Tax=Cognatishimia sp. F0-27 TaxID=2816855 RepID=UPI001D0C260A|nr:phage holin family protein [Cognatishimia sp. F0-27]MCC1493672.1 phage holin family protein [Cognatishimia sp. F0-27]